MTSLYLNTNTHNNNMQFNSDDAPPSPTFSIMSSFSWVAKKSPEELSSLLKSTYAAIQEKERDLMLAAEVGKTLLESNEMLAQKCNELQERIVERDMVVLRDEDDYQTDSIIEVKKEDQSSLIQSLEQQNAELQQKYESTVEYNEKIKRQNIATQKKLSKQIEDLQRALKEVYDNVHEQEKKREEFITAMKQKKKETEESPSAANEAIVTSLSNHIDQMTTQNESLSKTKDRIEAQYNEAIADLNYLQNQFKKMNQPKQEQVDILEERYREQKKHIHELTSWLNDYREDLNNDCESNDSKNKFIKKKPFRMSSLRNEDYSRSLLNKAQSNVRRMPAVTYEPTVHSVTSSNNDSRKMKSLYQPINKTAFGGESTPESVILCSDGVVVEPAPQQSTSSTLPALINADPRDDYSSSDEESELPVEWYETIPTNNGSNNLYSQLKSSLAEQETSEYPLDRSLSVVPRNNVTALVRQPRQIKPYPPLRIDDSVIPPAIRKPLVRSQSAVVTTSHNTNLITHIVSLPFNYFSYVWRFIRFLIVVHLAMLINLFFKKD